jgi:ATP-dependent DNA ligase
VDPELIHSFATSSRRSAQWPCGAFRLISRGGYDCGRYPWIVESALKNRHRQFVVDGEAVILGVDGIADFNALHSHRHAAVLPISRGGPVTLR